MTGPLTLPADDPNLIRVLSAMNDAEWAELVDKVRNPGLIPLADLVAQGSLATVDALAEQFGGQVVIDSAGRRCVPSSIAQQQRMRATAERH